LRWIGHRLCRTTEHWLHRRELTLVVAVFASSRVLMAFLAAFPQAYTPTVLPVTSDLFLYFRWAHEILGGSTPYADIAIEYPPGTLPFIVWPAVAKAAVGIPYRMGFIGTMVAVDAIVWSRLTHLSRRRGTWLGVWLWVLGLPLLGPLCWLRLDLVPAAATVVALECFVGHRSAAGGACLGLGAAVKVYPAFLLPSVLTLAGHPGRQLAAAAAAGALFVLPLAGVMPAAIANVAVYHAQRGIQLDSTWSNVLLLSAFSAIMSQSITGMVP
jgi:hypothetical protein